MQIKSKQIQDHHPRCNCLDSIYKQAPQIIKSVIQVFLKCVLLFFFIFFFFLHSLMISLAFLLTLTQIFLHLCLGTFSHLRFCQTYRDLILKPTIFSSFLCIFLQLENIIFFACNLTFIYNYKPLKLQY